MLSFRDATPIYLFTLPTDMRKSFDGLSGLIALHFDASVTDGALFVFINRRRDRMKVMYFDVDGLAIWYKRLERGRYELPMNPTGRCDVQIDARQLRLILDGIDLSSVRQRKRYTPPSRKHHQGVTDDDRTVHRTTATA
jgi:transposase